MENFCNSNYMDYLIGVRKMIIEIISTILLGLALLYFIGQSIYYYKKIDKLEKRIEELENEKNN